jgi:phospholipid/cholesterol/gamma-HCH transport system permease protein
MGKRNLLIIRGYHPELIKIRGKTIRIPGFLDGFLNYLYFSFKSIINFPQTIKYQGETFKQIFVLGAQALPLIILASIFVSMALSLEWGHQLDRFGAMSMIGGVLSNAVLREIGPLVVGLLIAGRTSAKITSEIGDMALTEQINALRAFGIDPIKRLVVPRLFGCIIVMAPLTIIADVLGIMSGWFAASTWLGIDPQYFWISAIEILYVQDLYLGILKPIIYGIFIGTISCYFGYTTTGGAEGMGLNTTKSVRYASVSVLLMDFIITKVIQSL